MDELLKTCLTFHGTQRHVVPSIVRHASLLPGDSIPGNGGKHSVRCGSTYGQGIYSGPSPWFSLSYPGNGYTATRLNEYDGLKLTVCATLMGVSVTVGKAESRRSLCEPVQGANSYVDLTQLEYVVFERTQIIPCYVTPLDWGNDNAKHFENIPSNPPTWVTRHRSWISQKYDPCSLGSGDKQRLKEALISKAAKYLPYGYGPATGISFVVEEVGEVSEDEEEYGEYQKDRIEDMDVGVNDIWRWSDFLYPGNSQIDEY